MTEFLIEYLEKMAEIALVWGPILVLIFMTIESSFIPFPSEVVMIPAGFMAARGEFPPGSAGAAVALAIFMGTLGSIAGAWINYGLSWYLGRPFLEKYGKYFFLKPAALHRAEEIFREYGVGTTFVCRFLPGIRQLISIPAGISGMNPVSFTLCTGVGAGIWVAFLTWLGYHFGSQFQDMTYAELVHEGKHIIHEYRAMIVIGCFAALGGYVWLHKKVMHGKSPSSGAPAARPRKEGSDGDKSPDEKPVATKIKPASRTADRKTKPTGASKPQGDKAKKADAPAEKAQAADNAPAPESAKPQPRSDSTASRPAQKKTAQRKSGGKKSGPGKSGGKRKGK